MKRWKFLLFSAVFIAFSGAETVFAQAEKVGKEAAGSTSILAGMKPEILLVGSVLIFLLALLVLFLVMTLMSAMPILSSFYSKPENKDLPMAGLVNLMRGDATALTGKHKDILIEDHSYDGIHELDNDLPPWWKYSFYLTIVFGFCYLMYYHVWSKGKLQTEEYQFEIEQAAILAANSSESDDPNAKTDYKVLTDNAALESGKTTFLQNCAACHGKAGEGAVGPNLTDEYWLHGGEINEVFKTIKFGVTSKGMVAWNKKLSSKQILEVASYIESIQGSKPANAKAPQGEKYVPKK